MYYADHSSFHFPANPSAKIWRYMDFTKFVSILETESLYFPRIDKLGDPYEYAVPQESLKRWRQARPDEVSLPFPIHKHFERCLYVSCWHCNEYESAAMWRLYLKSDEGIAIQSTATRFAESFCGYEDPVYIGEVSYIDYDRDDIPEGNLYDYALFKRISYHRTPKIVEASGDRTRVLVRFTAESMSGETFGGTCLYAFQEGQWAAYTIRPSESKTIAQAEAWLVKRKWQAW